MIVTARLQILVSLKKCETCWSWRSGNHDKKWKLVITALEKKECLNKDEWNNIKEKRLSAGFEERKEKKNIINNLEWDMQKIIIQ